MELTEEQLLLAGAGAYGLWRYSALATGNPDLDRFAIRGRALYWSIRLPLDGQALQAVAWDESGGKPSEYLGDMQNARGPSVGPLMASRATCIEKGFVPADISREEFAAYAGEEYEGLTYEWGARIFSDYFVANGGDLRTTWWHYNGSRAYAAKLADFFAQTFGRVV